MDLLIRKSGIPASCRLILFLAVVIICAYVFLLPGATVIVLSYVLRLYFSVVRVELLLGLSRFSPADYR